ncbi:MAG: hypothetical protein K6L81_06565 [Agarilytica sp.]
MVSSLGDAVVSPANPLKHISRVNVDDSVNTGSTLEVQELMKTPSFK